MWPCSWIMQTAFAALSATLYPPPVLNSQMPQLVLAVRDVARGDGGGGALLSFQPQHTHPITDKSALGKARERKSGQERGGCRPKAKAEISSPCSLEAKGWGIFFFFNF